MKPYPLWRFWQWLREAEYDRSHIHLYGELARETTPDAAPIIWTSRPLPSGRVGVVREVDHEGICHEIAFRDYARRSGERLRSWPA